MLHSRKCLEDGTAKLEAWGNQREGYALHAVWPHDNTAVHVGPYTFRTLREARRYGDVVFDLRAKLGRNWHGVL